jgi:hypothetical protein
MKKISPHRYFKYNIPYKAWRILKPKVTHFQIFSSRAWAQISFEKKKAFDPHSTECTFVGYPDGVKGYRLIYISSYRLIIECSVQFKEIFSHVPQQPHENTFIFPLVRDDEHAHVDSSNESFDLEDSYDSNLELV